VRLRGGAAALDLVRLGPPAGAPPAGIRAAPEETGERKEAPGGEGRFLTLFSDYLRGRVGFWFLILFCFAYGMGHALTPGHGKALVAAYLIGTRGRIRDAIALGLTTTITHTAVVYIFAIAGVALLGITAKASTGYINEVTVAMQILSGFLITGMGIFIFRRFGRVRPHGHEHSHEHPHPHPHGDPPRLRELLGFGISGGAVPCPTLLVILIVLLPQYAALPDKTIIFLPLIAFSIGLGGVLTGLGIVLVTTKRFVAGEGAARRWASRSRLGRIALRALPKLPRASAVVIMILGVILVADAVRRGSFEIASLLRAIADRLAPAG
ncbi:MAG: hypothetical protein JXP34_03980, partial [Planctomycetes bacterium]|nr:hypothetical protein [Planctomycetota bacterium]